MACAAVAGIRPDRCVGTSSAQARRWAAQAFLTVELNEALVTIVMGLDQHRAQLTAEWVDTSNGEISRARVAPAHRGGVRRFFSRFGGQELRRLPLEFPRVEPRKRDARPLVRLPSCVLDARKDNTRVCRCRVLPLARSRSLRSPTGAPASSPVRYSAPTSMTLPRSFHRGTLPRLESACRHFYFTPLARTSRSRTSSSSDRWSSS